MFYVIFKNALTPGSRLESVSVKSAWLAAEGKNKYGDAGKSLPFA